MIKDRIHIFRRLNLFADSALAGVSFTLAMLIKVYMEIHKFVITENYQNYTWLFYVVIILWPALLRINHLYPTNRMRTLGDTYWIIVRSSLQGFLIIMAFLFIFKLQMVSRMIIIIFTILIILFLIIKESIITFTLRKARSSGVNFRNMIIVGTERSAYDFIQTITKSNYLGFKLLGIVVPPSELDKGTIGGAKILGTFRDMENILHNVTLDNVVITLDRKDYGDVDDMIVSCEERGIEVWLTANLFNLKIASLDIDHFYGHPIFVFKSGPRFSWQMLTKLIFDKIGATIFGILCLPIILLAAILIKATSNGPILFKQERCGVQGRKFTLYKFRTMYIGSERQQAELMKKNIVSGPAFKVENDPRITPLGKILRKTSVDELPQFWNVLKGDMSLIGPRPPVPAEVLQYHGWQRRRLSMKPGITGLWQVSGRNTITCFDSLTNLDLEYIDNWSLSLDLRIFFKTFPAILRMKGAN